MQLEDYFDFLAPDDIRLKGHRIGIETVLYEYVYRARTPEEIADDFPSLNLEQVYATILYYLRNQKDVCAYLTAWLQHGEQMRAGQARNPTPAMLKLRQVRLERESGNGQRLELQPA